MEWKSRLNINTLATNFYMLYSEICPEATTNTCCTFLCAPILPVLKPERDFNNRRNYNKTTCRNKILIAMMLRLITPLYEKYRNVKCTGNS